MTNRIAMQKKETETFCPSGREQWRRWLQKNHRSKPSVWIIYHKLSSGKPSLSWSEAVDEALCFGWIDSTKKSIDDATFTQFFSRRKPNSTWSKINKEKVVRLIAEGRMTPAGYESIETAKQNGSWSMLDDAEALVVPADLEAAFAGIPGAGEFFRGFSRSSQKAILQWLVLARLEETRKKRVAEIAALAGLNQKPKQFR